MNEREGSKRESQKNSFIAYSITAILIGGLLSGFANAGTCPAGTKEVSIDLTKVITKNGAETSKDFGGITVTSKTVHAGTAHIDNSMADHGQKKAGVRLKISSKDSMGNNNGSEDNPDVTLQNYQVVEVKFDSPVTLNEDIILKDLDGSKEPYIDAATLLVDEGSGIAPAPLKEYGSNLIEFPVTVAAQSSITIPSSFKGYAPPNRKSVKDSQTKNWVTYETDGKSVSAFYVVYWNNVVATKSKGSQGISLLSPITTCVSDNPTPATGNIKGSVKDDEGNAIEGVTIKLLDSNGKEVATTTTKADGSYEFLNIAEGEYVVQELDPSGYSSVSDSQSPDDDTTYNSDTNDNKIPVTLSAGEDDVNNDFVDAPDKGNIRGLVKNSQDKPVGGVKIDLVDSDGKVVKSTTTKSDGTYEFLDIPVGEYEIVEHDPKAARGSISDTQSSDGDRTDNIDKNDNKIPVTLTKDENDNDNIFVDDIDLGDIKGSVADNEDNALKDVTIELKDSDGNVVATTTTDANGAYEFLNIPVGEYSVVESDPKDYISQSDTQSSDNDTTANDDTNDNIIPVTLTKDEVDENNDFVDMPVGYIEGSVKNNDSKLVQGVTINLKDDQGNIVATTTTNKDGNFKFEKIPLGEYVIEEIDPDSATGSVSDTQSPDNDTNTNDDTNDNLIPVSLKEKGEVDKDNIFVDEVQLGNIRGSVKDNLNNPIKAVTIELKDSNGNTVATTTTKDDGTYEFVNIPVGEYAVVEQDLDRYISISDTQSQDDDNIANDNTNDNIIPVTLSADENDEDNDFVDAALRDISGSVKDKSGAPISGVVIKLKDKDGNEVAQTTTKDDGTYEFKDIPTGEYVIEEIDPQDYTSVSDTQSSDGDTVSNDDTNDNLIPVTLTANEDADKNNDFVDVATGNIKGLVKDDKGNPLKDVTIELKDKDGKTVATTTTDNNGNYEFIGIEVGEYTIVESDPKGFESVSDEQSKDDDSATNSNTNDNIIPVTLTKAENDIDNIFIDKLGDTGNISGTVVDEDGKPLKDVVVKLKDSNGEVIKETKTDKSGAYSFVNIPVGDYVIVEEDPKGFESVEDIQSQDGDATANSNTNDNEIPVTLTKDEDDKNNVFIDKAPNGVGNISGSVKDKNSKPLENVTIVLKDSNGTIVATTTTNDKGEYEFTDIPVGDYVIVEKDPIGYSSVKDEQSSDDDKEANSDTNDNEIPVSLSKDENDVKNDFIDQAIGHIAGAVVDENDSPIKGVEVELKDKDGKVVATTTTDNNGEYAFLNIPVGDYVIVEKDPTGYSSIGDNQSSDDDKPNSNTNDNEIPVTLSAGEIDLNNIFKDHTPAQKGTIKGVVGDIDNNTPLKDVTVLLKDSKGNVVATTKTDANGMYEFKDIPVGEYVVVEEDPIGYTSVGDEQSNDNDQTANSNINDNEIPVTLTDGEVDSGNNFGDRAPAKKGNISGSVKDSDGNGIDGVTIELKDSSGNVVATTTTNDKGEYEFKNIPEGDYIIVEKDPIGYSSVSDEQSSDGDKTPNSNSNDNEIPVTLTNGEDDKDNNFIDKAAGQIMGSVVDDNDKPIKDVVIKLKDKDGNVVAQTTTDSEGKYYFSDIPLGEYVIVEEDPRGYSSISDEQSADNDNTPNSNTNDNEIPVSLKYAGEIDKDNNFKDKAPTNTGSASGSVKDDKGNPLEGVTIELTDMQGDLVATTTTDKNGEYEFSNIPEGDYIIVEKDPIDYLSIKDEQSKDNDHFTNDDTNDNIIPLTIKKGENDTNNNFTDKKIEPKDDSKFANPGEAVVVDVLANDEGEYIPDTLKLLDQNGDEVEELEVDGQGVWQVVDGKIKFTPAKLFLGSPDPVEYSVRGANGYKVLAQASVYSLKAVDDGTIVVKEYKSYCIDVLKNDIPKESQGLRIKILTQPKYGTVKVVKRNGKECIEYTPKGDYNNVNDSFKYTIIDQQGNSDDAEVTLKVECTSTQKHDLGAPSFTQGGMLIFATVILLMVFRKEEKKGEI